jgi:hypothetical protein
MPSMRAACLALLTLTACAGPRHVAVRDNLPGWVTVGVGGLAVVAGALVGGHGAAYHGTSDCALYPQTVQNCNQAATQMEAGGFALLGIGLAGVIAGGTVIGVQAHARAVGPQASSSP